MQIRLDFALSLCFWLYALFSGGVGILPCFLKIFPCPVNVENPSVSMEQQSFRSTTCCLAPKTRNFLLVDFSWFSHVRTAGVLDLQWSLIEFQHINVCPLQVFCWLLHYRFGCCVLYLWKQTAKAAVSSFEGKRGVSDWPPCEQQFHFHAWWPSER